MRACVRVTVCMCACVWVIGRSGVRGCGRVCGMRGAGVPVCMSLVFLSYVLANYGVKRSGVRRMV